MTHIQRAVESLGLAGIGSLYTPPISAQAVHKWKEDGKVPAGRCAAIVRAMNGEVTREGLCPDFDWAIPHAAKKGVRHPAAPEPFDCGTGDPRQGIEKRQSDQRQFADRRKDK